MDHLLEFTLFSAKVLIVVSGLIAVLITIATLIQKSKDEKVPLSIEDLSKRLRTFKETLQDKVLTEKELKKVKKERKKLASKVGKAESSKPKIFVIDFEGDIKASAVKQMQNEISALLTLATPSDEVVLRLESPGGMVHSYGFAAAQLLRIRDKQIPLTICVDKVAASGGYMMACTANQIIAAPFAVLGSIGVIAQVPNFNRLLKKHDIDYEEMKAGEYKRTVSMFGKITDKGKEKFLEQIEETHQLFKDFISENRKELDLPKIATGETWYGRQALEKNLIDRIQTSDQYLMDRSESHQLVQLSIKPKKSVIEKFTESASLALERVIEKILTQNQV
ncbi:protease SohB [Bdellovibrionales bacterium]|nr:protease SohB [Bdellovibrionales bacterium]